MRESLIVALLVATTACGGTDGTTPSPPYQFPVATITWVQPAYSIPSGSSTVGTELQLSWDVDTAASLVTGTWVKVEALGWQSVDPPVAPYPYLMMQGLALPCRPCTKTITLSRVAPGTWTYRATFDPFNEYGQQKTVDTTVTVQ